MPKKSQINEYTVVIFHFIFILVLTEMVMGQSQ